MCPGGKTGTAMRAMLAEMRSRPQDEHAHPRIVHAIPRPAAAVSTGAYGDGAYEGRIILPNAALCDMLGLGADDLAGVYWRDVMMDAGSCTLDRSAEVNGRVKVIAYSREVVSPGGASLYAITVFDEIARTTEETATATEAILAAEAERCEIRDALAAGAARADTRRREVLAALDRVDGRLAALRSVGA